MATPPPKFCLNSHKWTSSQDSTTLAMWRNTTPEIHKHFRSCFKWKMYAWILWKMKKKKKQKKEHLLLLILTLSEMGITLYLSHLVTALHTRFVLLDISSTYWGQTITNLFDKQFSFTWHLILHSCGILLNDFHGFFRTYIDNTKICHVNFARQLKSLPQEETTTIVCCNPLNVGLIFNQQSIKAARAVFGRIYCTKVKSDKGADTLWKISSSCWSCEFWNSCTFTSYRWHYDYSSGGLLRRNILSID